MMVCGRRVDSLDEDRLFVTIECLLHLRQSGVLWSLAQRRLKLPL